MTETLKLLEKRIVYRESTVQGPSLSKPAAELHSLFRNVVDGKDEKLQLESFLNSIMWFKLETLKDQRSMNNFAEEIVEYQELENITDFKIQETKQSIILLREELYQQQRIRGHREECDRMAREVNKLPNRSLMVKEISDIKETLTKTKEQTLITDFSIRMRLKQIQLLISSITSIQNSLIDDDDLNKYKSQLECVTVDDDHNDPEDIPERDDEPDLESRARKREISLDHASEMKKQRVDGGDEPAPGSEESDRTALNNGS